MLNESWRDSFVLWNDIFIDGYTTIPYAQNTIQN
jgi:hypothetical protein